MPSPLSVARAADPRPVPMTDARPPGRPIRRPPAGLLTGFGLAVLFGVLAFWAAGGASLAAVTWTEIALVGLGLGLCGAATLARPLTRPLARPGVPAAALFVAVAALSAVSIAWSVAPDQSWLTAARTASYAAVFAGTLAAAWLWPARWPALLWAIAAAAGAVSAWAVAVKVLTLNVDGQPGLGRLLAPFGYWNVTGLMAALGLPALLWIASRREGARSVPRALATGGMTLQISVVVLSYSRSALLAAVLGVLVLLFLSVSRLRMLAMLAPAAAGAAIVCAWALGNPAITNDQVADGPRHVAGHTLGWVMLATLAAVTGVAWLVAHRVDRTTLSAATRRQMTRGLAVLVSLVPVGAVVGAAASSRGLGGEVSHVWSTLTSTKATIGDRPGRLVAISNSRPRYWRQGIVIGEHHLLAGAGAGSFAVARLRYPEALLTPNGAGHAHSYVIQTFADLGLIGLALNLALFLLWGRATVRTLGWRRRGVGGERPAPRGERDGLLALLGVVVAFGLSSAVDWTWSFPGVAVPALVAAAWLAGRGPLDRLQGDRDGWPAAPKAADRRPLWSLAGRPGAVLGLTALLAAALGVGWAIWQPLRSSDAVAAGISAIAAGDARAALADGQAAEREDPFSLEPIQELAAVHDALHEPAAALAAYAHGTRIQPQNAVAWTWLGMQELSLGHPRPALRDLQMARRLDTIPSPDLAAGLAAAQAAVAHHGGAG